MNQETSNNHYLAQCFTKPWEVSERQAHVLDPSDRSIKLRRTKSFFARQKVYSQTEEDFLRSEVETPLAVFRERVRRALRPGIARTEVLHTASLKEFFSLLNLWHTAPLRFAYAIQDRDDFGPPLDFVKRGTAEEQTAFYKLVATRYEVVLATVPKETPLFLPEIGYFLVWLNRLDVPYVVAVPIDLQIALCFCPRFAVDTLKQMLRDDAGVLADFSVASKDSQGGIVVPPAYLEGGRTNELIQHALAMREYNSSLVRTSQARCMTANARPLTLIEILRGHPTLQDRSDLS